MSPQQPLSDADAQAVAEFVEPYTCSIQFIPRNDTQDPPGHHHGTGWLFDNSGEPCIVTCEHVSRWQKHGVLGYSCFETEYGISIEGKFVEVPHPVDAAVATVKRSFTAILHQGKCVPSSMFDIGHAPVQNELFYAYGFPGADAKQLFGTQVVVGTSVFLRLVELNEAVFQEEPPHPDPALHMSLAWQPEHALPMLGTTGTLSLPNGMSGSLLWNTRYEEVTRLGEKWSPAEMRIAGMIWGHSSKSGQLYATPIETIVAELLC
jgi:hypothetical protein